MRVVYDAKQKILDEDCEEGWLAKEAQLDHGHEGDFPLD